MGQAQKRKLQRRLQQPVQPPSRRWHWVAVVFVLFFLLPIRSDRNARVRYFTEAEGLELVNGLLAAVSPGNPENAFMPPLMREKIQWVYNTHAQQLLDGHKFVNAITDYARDERGNHHDRVLMTSGYDKGRPFINIFLSRLMVIVRDQYRVEHGFNELAKHVFAIGLTHEAVHLEQPADYYAAVRSQEDQLVEEVRTWRKMGLEVIRPLRQTGQLVEIDFIKADDALSQCADPYQCPQFYEFVRKQQSGFETWPR